MPSRVLPAPINFIQIRGIPKYFFKLIPCRAYFVVVADKFFKRGVSVIGKIDVCHLKLFYRKIDLNKSNVKVEIIEIMRNFA